MRRHWIKSLFVTAVASMAVALGSTAQAGIVKEDYAAYQINFAAGTPTTSGQHTVDRAYPLGNGDNGHVTLVPASVTALAGNSVCGSQNFFDVVNTAFPASKGWTYACSTNRLSDDSLVVHTYDARGNITAVGAEFHMEYVPHGTDPTTNIHWIQVVTDNHKIVGGDQHGVVENIVDQNNGGRSPYYDDGFAATQRNFYDFPGREGDKPHYWNAELLLVTGPAPTSPGLVTFYGGVTWGWANTVPVPAAASLGMVLLAVLVLSTARRARLRPAMARR